MQINRLFEIVYILLNKKMTTTSELAKRLEVSRRTILRDIEALSQAGIPICTTPGKGGGVFILDNFVLNKTAISDEEQNQILFALESLSFSEHLKSSDVLKRLRVLFGKTDTDWIEVDFSRWGYRELDREKFELLKLSILQKLALSITYANSYGKTTTRTVYPLKLVFKFRSWYLHAYCLLKEDYRIFKINRILSMEVLKETFAGKAYSPPPVDIEPPLPRTVSLILKFERQALYRVYDEFSPENITVNRDGSFTVTTKLPDDNWLYGFILSFGSSVKVISPESVREHLSEELDKIRNSVFEI